jgi:hypothetical protein
VREVKGGGGGWSCASKHGSGCNAFVVCLVAATSFPLVDGLGYSVVVIVVVVAWVFVINVLGAFRVMSNNERL